ncbi:PAC2 family protein [Candidatus Micrarchaeota archaeon]|nr:PAC2 family protein [Candidatus Micrarchaeota archaeon]
MVVINKTFVKTLKKVKMKNPILVEGLPGIGLVGKMVIDIIKEQYESVKIAEIYSPHFPHQVNMNKDGIITPVTFDLYHVNTGNIKQIKVNEKSKSVKKNIGKSKIKDDKKMSKAKNYDLVLLVGDVQPMTSEAQYDINGVIIEYCKNLGCKEVITLGGYATGILRPKIKVHGASTDKQMITKYSKYGVVFGKTKGAIIGAAGLLLLMAKLNNIPAVCIMGETHGGYVDPKASLNILEVLSKSHNINVNTEYLDKIAKTNENLLRELEKSEKVAAPTSSEKRGLSYIR